MILIIRKIIEIIVYGNVWISLGAVAFTLNTFLLMKWEFDLKFLTLIFFATILSYSFQRVIRHNENRENNSIRHNWVFSRKKRLFLLIVLYLLISIVLFFTLFSWIDLLYFSPLIIIALFYAVKTTLLKRALRDIPFLKIILIAFSWASVSVLIPFYIQKTDLTDQIIWLFILNFIYIFALVIPFDIRDLPFDEPDKKTFPQLLGMKSAKILSMILFLICALLTALFLEEIQSLLPIYIVSAIIILFSNSSRKELFYTGVLDGLILLFPISTYIFKMILSNN